MMMTNPNTLGLFERDIPAITKLVHDAGGLMYYDGANLNPMLGVARPADMGFDVMHLNLHKTFSTPHGGGGPGSGPVGVREGLEPFLPKPHVVKNGDKFDIEQPERTDSYTVENNHVGPFLGNFLVIVRALSYILSLGKENIKMVGPLSVLNANYIKESLKDDYEHRYTDYASTNSFSMASRTSRPALLPWMWPSVCSIMAIMLQLFTFRCFSMKP